MHDIDVNAMYEHHRRDEEARVAAAKRRAEELYAAATGDSYRIPNCDDMLTNHIARMLRCRHRESEGQVFSMSPATLASACGVSPPTIQRRLDYLVRHGHFKLVLKGSRGRGSSRWKWIGAAD